MPADSGKEFFAATSNRSVIGVALGVGIADRTGKVARDAGLSTVPRRVAQPIGSRHPAVLCGQADLTHDFPAGTPVRNPGGHRAGYGAKGDRKLEGQ